MKIIIADDEKWIRKMIIGMIPFVELGLELSGEASNGHEALSLCEQNQPDILITDIMMPGLTGLELIERVKKVQPNIKIVIISGYSDFEYSKKAIRYGVSEYLLKPVEDSELIDVLVRLKNAINFEKAHSQEIDNMKKQNKLALPVMYEAFLNRLISANTFTIGYIMSSLKSFNIDLSYNYFTVVIFSIEGGNNIYQNKLSEKVKKAVSWIMGRYLVSLSFSPSANEQRIVSIINFNSMDDCSIIEKAVNISLGFLKKKTDCKAAAGVSLIAKQIVNVQELFVQAEKALEKAFWNVETDIYRYDPKSTVNENSFLLPGLEKTVDDIVNCIKQLNSDDSYLILSSFLNNIKNSQCIQPAAAKETIWLILQSVLNKLGIFISFADCEEIKIHGLPYQRIKEARNITMLQNSIRQILEQIKSHYASTCYGEPKGIVNKVKSLLQQNFNNDFTLEKAAKCVHLNPTYLSELFKKETGISFIEYKTLLKVEHAKKLLLETRLSVTEISGKVGYTDCKYFSKLFKNVTGMTLQEFKKRSTGINDTSLKI